MQTQVCSFHQNRIAITEPTTSGSIWAALRPSLTGDATSVLWPQSGLEKFGYRSEKTAPSMGVNDQPTPHLRP